MTTTEIAKKCNLKRETISARLKILGLNVNKKGYDYSDEVVKAVSYTHRVYIFQSTASSKLSIKIMELYLYDSNNCINTIANAVNCSTGIVSNIIDNYFKNKGLIVESKINEK